MKIQDRYASAVRSSNLASTPETYMSDTDTLGAYGIADRRLSAGIGQFDRHPLAVPLERLLTGDNTAARQITRILEDMIRTKAPRLRVKVTQAQAWDMARATLAWYRQNACRVCGGHGYEVIPGTTTLGERACVPCCGTGKIQLELEFHRDVRSLVAWVMAEVEREAGRAGPEAMKAIAPRLELDDAL